MAFKPLAVVETPMVLAPVRETNKAKLCNVVVYLLKCT